MTFINASSNRSSLSHCDHHICPAGPRITDQDRADLARFLREAIEADRFPLSPRVRRLKELLAKIDPAPAPAGPPKKEAPRPVSRRGL